MGGVCGKTKDAQALLPVEKYTHSNLDSSESEVLSSFLVGKILDIQDDKFTEVKITEEKSVLVARHGENFFAIGNKCPHAGAPLLNGVVSDGKVRCPWHAACFDLKTGDLEDFPGFDCLPSYEVSVAEPNVYVKLNPKKMVDRVMKPMTKMSQVQARVVIIGSGPAGYSCAQTLREEGYAGKITMITQDAHFPYDRTKLTKRLNCTFEDIKIREPTFYEENNIEVILNRTVENVNTENHSITFQGNLSPEITYDSLFLAVGMKPRILTPGVVGDDLKNIHVLHSLEQCTRITEMAHGMDILLIGSSFISMELAELLSPIAGKIQILSRSRVPYGLVFGDTTGEALLAHFLTKLPNVVFHASTEVAEFIGNDTGEVCGVRITNDTIINCQLVVTAIGGTPATAFLKHSQISLHPTKETILVNEFLETKCAKVYGGGDAVSFPFHLSPIENGTVAHWQLASLHGLIAAKNILGRGVSTLDIVPFFWTNICGLQVRYTGYGEGHDETLIYGDIKKLYFCVVYRRNEHLTAVCCVGCDKLAAELAMIFQKNMKWVGDIPGPILQRFAEPPVKVESI